MKQFLHTNDNSPMPTCSGCYNRHEPEMCPHGDMDSLVMEWECSHGHFNCTKH